MERYAKKCLEVCCELANEKTSSNYTKSRHLASTITSSIKEELETVGGLPHVCSSIVLKCFCVSRIGRPDIVWFVNKQARADTRWTRAVRLISYIDFNGDFRQNCHVGNTAEQCTLGLFQDSFNIWISMQILRPFCALSGVYHSYQ